jgi:hypothetical protein
MWLGGTLLLLSLICGTAVKQMARGKYEPIIARTQAEAASNLDFFCEQQEFLAQDPWFHMQRTEGDAGPLLNAWLPWEPALQLPTGSPLAVPNSLPRSNKDFRDWLTASSVEVSVLDFEWMRRLRAYDHWDLLKNAPVEPREPFELAKAQLPDFNLLQLWAKFRLLHGVRSGQPLEAAEDVRHLAWLSYRMDTVFGGSLAAELLRLERQAYDSVQAPPPEWRPMPTLQIERLRALTLSSLAFSHVSAPAEVARRARRCGDPVVTRCIALSETAFMARFLKPLAEDDYPEEYRALTEDLEAFPCSTSVPRTVWERGVIAGGPLEGTSFEKIPAVRLPRPFFGEIMAGVFLSSGSEWLQQLHELRRSLKSEPSP